VDSRAARAGGALAVLSALLVTGCPVDERPLQPLPIFWLPSDDAGQGGDGEAGNPNPFEAGKHGGGKGGTGAKGGSGGTGGSAAGGAGSSNAGNGGIAGIAGNTGGMGGKPAPGCEDLDSDGVPDCQETLVKNGSFDTNVADWIADEVIQQSWAQADANDQLESGSITVKNTTIEEANGYTVSGTQQCVNIVETGAYHFVSELFIAEGQGEGNAGVNLWFWNLPDCQGAIIDTGSQFAGKLGVWQLVYANPVTPMGARSVAVRLVAAKPFRSPEFTASFDNILFVQD